MLRFHINAVASQANLFILLAFLTKVAGSSTIKRTFALSLLFLLTAIVHPGELRTQALISCIVNYLNVMLFGCWSACVDVTSSIAGYFLGEGLRPVRDRFLLGRDEPEKYVLRLVMLSSNLMLSLRVNSHCPIARACVPCCMHWSRHIFVFIEICWTRGKVLRTVGLLGMVLSMHMLFCGYVLPIAEMLACLGLVLTFGALQHNVFLLRLLVVLHAAVCIAILLPAIEADVDRGTGLGSAIVPSSFASQASGALDMNNISWMCPGQEGQWWLRAELHAAKAQAVVARLELNAEKDARVEAHRKLKEQQASAAFLRAQLSNVVNAKEMLSEQKYEHSSEMFLGTTVVVIAVVCIALLLAALICLSRDLKSAQVQLARLRGVVPEEFEALQAQGLVGSLGSDFDFCVYDEITEQEHVRILKIQCTGIDYEHVSVELVSNGCVVTIRREASKGLGAAHWVRRFQFRPSDGFFEFKEDQAQLEHGVLLLFFKVYPLQTRIWRFPKLYNMAVVDANCDYELLGESAAGHAGEPELSERHASEAIADRPSGFITGSISKAGEVLTSDCKSASDSSWSWVTTHRPGSPPQQPSAGEVSVSDAMGSSLSAPVSNRSQHRLLAGSSDLVPAGF